MHISYTNFETPFERSLFGINPRGYFLRASIPIAPTPRQLVRHPPHDRIALALLSAPGLRYGLQTTSHLHVCLFLLMCIYTINGSSILAVSQTYRLMRVQAPQKKNGLWPTRDRQGSGCLPHLGLYYAKQRRRKQKTQPFGPDY